MYTKTGCILLVDEDKMMNHYCQLIIAEASPALIVKSKNTMLEAFFYLALSDLQAKKMLPGFPFPDIILLDIDMQGQIGWDFLLQYNEVKNVLLSKPIILLISQAMNSSNKARASNIPEISGVYDKPLTLVTVNEILKKYLPTPTW